MDKYYKFSFIKQSAFAYNLKRWTFSPQIAVLAVLGLAAVCTARPQQAYSTPIPIISYNQEGPNSDGSYKWR
jgi:energy-converting hydrogenase Eha subunit F